MLDIKSVQSNLQVTEARLLSKILKESKDVGRTDWLPDSIIDAFLMRICDQENNGVVSVTVQEAQNLFSGNDTTLLFSEAKLNGKDYHEWADISKVLIPFNLDGNHWILIVLKGKTKMIQGILQDFAYRVEERVANKLTGCHILNYCYSF